MPATPHTEGLLGKGISNREGKHLYHPTKPAFIAYTADQEAAALADGYGEEYVHQEYPKSVNGKTARNAEEEAAILAAEVQP